MLAAALAGHDDLVVFLGEHAGGVVLVVEPVGDDNTGAPLSARSSF